jgi:hypothetical protein
MRAGAAIANKKTGEVLTMIESENNAAARQPYQVRLPPPMAAE